MNKNNKLNILRNKLNQTNISFIQIGSNDGITNDVANNILTHNDQGIFIEPCRIPFEKLLYNKKDFNNSLFLNLAIVPEIMAHKNCTLNLLSDDPLNQGASILDNIPSSYRKVKSTDTQVMSISKLIDNYDIKELDIFFCDAEGLDHILISELLNYIQPKILFFESFFWLNQDLKINIDSMANLIIPSRSTIKQILKQYNYSYIDFNDEINENKSEDIVAWKDI